MKRVHISIPVNKLGLINCILEFDRSDSVNICFLFVGHILNWLSF